MKFIEITRFKDNVKRIVNIETICNIFKEKEKQYISSADVWTDFIPCIIETDGDFIRIREKYSEIKDMLKGYMI